MQDSHEVNEEQMEEQKEETPEVEFGDTSGNSIPDKEDPDIRADNVDVDPSDPETWGDTEWDVEKIVDVEFQFREGLVPKIWFKIKWRGYANRHNSWIPIEEVTPLAAYTTFLESDAKARKLRKAKAFEREYKRNPQQFMAKYYRIEAPVQSESPQPPPNRKIIKTEAKETVWIPTLTEIEMEAKREEFERLQNPTPEDIEEDKFSKIRKRHLRQLYPFQLHSYWDRNPVMPRAPATSASSACRSGKPRGMLNIESSCSSDTHDLRRSRQAPVRFTAGSNEIATIHQTGQPTTFNKPTQRFVPKMEVPASDASINKLSTSPSRASGQRENVYPVANIKQCMDYAPFDDDLIATDTVTRNSADKEQQSAAVVEENYAHGHDNSVDDSTPPSPFEELEFDDDEEFVNLCDQTAGLLSFAPNLASCGIVTHADADAKNVSVNERFVDAFSTSDRVDTTGDSAVDDSGNKSISKRSSPPPMFQTISLSSSKDTLCLSVSNHQAQVNGAWDFHCQRATTLMVDSSNVVTPLSGQFLQPRLSENPSWSLWPLPQYAAGLSPNISSSECDVQSAPLGAEVALAANSDYEKDVQSSTAVCSLTELPQSVNDANVLPGPKNGATNVDVVKLQEVKEELCVLLSEIQNTRVANGMDETIMRRLLVDSLPDCRIPLLDIDCIPAVPIPLMTTNLTSARAVFSHFCPADQAFITQHCLAVCERLRADCISTRLNQLFALAVKAGDVDLVNDCLRHARHDKYALDVEQPDHGGFTLLHIVACKTCSEDNRHNFCTVFEKLLLLNADVNATSVSGVTPLMLACTVPDSSRRVMRLLERDAFLNVEDRRGYTALCYAVERNQVNAAMMLLYQGAVVHRIVSGAGCSSVLHFAHRMHGPKDYITQLLNVMVARFQRAFEAEARRACGGCVMLIRPLLPLHTVKYTEVLKRSDYMWAFNMHSLPILCSDEAVLLFVARCYTRVGGVTMFSYGPCPLRSIVLNDNTAMDAYTSGGPFITSFSVRATYNQLRLVPNDDDGAIREFKHCLVGLQPWVVKFNASKISAMMNQ